MTLAPVLMKAAGGPEHLAIHKKGAAMRAYCRICLTYATPTHLVSVAHHEKLVEVLRSLGDSGAGAPE
eukprot:762008-Lingulodinium_polyedra.AAC.1